MLLDHKPRRLVSGQPSLVSPVRSSAPADRRRRWANPGQCPAAFEFSYAHGRWTERSVPPLLPPRGKSRKGQLYVLADVDGRSADETAEWLRHCVADAFYRDSSGSLTSALVRAVQLANEELYEENQRSIRTDRQYATLCCAVLRDDDAFFALAGRSLTYLIRPDQGERFGRGDPRPGAPPAVLLGQVDDIEVELHHRSLDRQLTIMLTSSGVIDLVGDHSDDALRGQPDRVVDGLRFVGRQHSGRRPFRALVILPDAGRFDDPEPGLHTIEPAEPPPRAARNGRSARSSDRPATLPTSPPQPRWAADADPEQDEPAVPRRLASLLDLLPVPNHPLQLALGVIGLVALFLAGYVGVLIAARILQGGSAYTQAISALSQAQQREREAMGQNDPVVRRHLLETANQLASQALKQRPDDALTITTAGRIEREYRAASGISILPAPTTLVDLPTPADLLIVNGTDVYALDRANSRLYRYLLSADGTAVQAGANPTVVQQGDHIGPVTVGKLTAAAWMPFGPDRAGAGLITLDSSGFLIKYDPTLGLSTLRLRDPGSWSTVTAVAGQEGKLFALNAAQQTLAWYPPQPGGYDGPVYNYLAAGVAANLGDAVDLAVDDGLYLLHANGQVQKFVDGKPVAFAGPPGDLMPSHPSGLALSNDSIYVGDPEHARILQLARDGTYRRVLTSDGSSTILAHLRDLAVPDGASAIYVLADTRIYRFSLPELRP